MSFVTELVTLLHDMKENGEIDQATYDAVYQWGTTSASENIFTDAEAEEELPFTLEFPPGECPFSCSEKMQTHTHTVDRYRRVLIFVLKGVAHDDSENHIVICEDDPDRLEKMRELLADGATIARWAKEIFLDGQRHPSAAVVSGMVPDCAICKGSKTGCAERT